MPIVIPPSAPAGTLVVEWIEPNGTVHNLTQNTNVMVLWGVRGTGYPHVDLAEDKLPFTSGTVARHLAIHSRLVELPLYLQSASSSAQESLMDAVHGWFATADEQTLTPGILRVTRTDGAIRQIRAFYVGGLEGDLSLSSANVTWQRANVQLRAADPWATDVDFETTTWAAAELPDVAVINAGQIEAFPIWDIHGPVTELSMNNITIGKTWLVQLTTPLASDKTLRVDTRPASQRTTVAILDSDGNSRFQELNPGSFLWRLYTGQNNLQLDLTGTGANTTVTVTWLQRYRSLLR